MSKLKIMKKTLSILIATLCCVSIVEPFMSFAGGGKNDEGADDVCEQEESMIYVRGNHPRQDEIWLQYFPLTTALRKNIVISDVITPDSSWEDWSGNSVEIHDMSNENAENYDDSHNHYQNLLSEVLNFSTGTNAVAIWGDSSAVVDGSKAWGGFFSARSNIKQFIENEEFSKYIPDNVELEYNSETYDTQLIGIEVDVLNDGLPGVYPNMSKTGIQVVGFGNPNSMAIEVRSEDSDKSMSNEERRGVFESGIYFKNSIAEYGRLMVSDLPSARIGLDFDSTLFSEGAMKLKSEQVGTGIIFNDGDSGEIYGGDRWNSEEDGNDWLTLRAGDGGIRIVSNDNTKELVAIDNYGGIYLNGDVYMNGTKVNAPNNNYTKIILGLIIVNFSILIIFALYILRMRKRIAALENI